MNLKEAWADDGEDLEFCGYDKSEALAICKAAIEAMNESTAKPK